MNKQLKVAKQSFAEFADKMSARWKLHTLPNTPSKVEEDESTQSILADLVAMPTVTGNYDANHEALDYIENFLSKHGLHVKRFAWNGVESLVATTRKTKTPTVFLAGHIDVVPAPEDQFQMQEREGKLYGRGVIDMKGAVAAYLGVVRDLGGSVHNYDFGILLTTDEEVSGFDGAARLADAGYLPKVMVLFDGGSNWNLEKFAKGVWHATLETSGKNAHGSRPWEGINAVDALITVLQDIKTLFPKNQSLKTSTLNIGIVRGGKAINQIPARASASLDMRFVSPAEQLHIKDRIEKIAKKHGAILTTEVEAAPVINDPGNPYLVSFARHTEEVIGRPVEWITSNASHDGRFFAWRGVPLAVTYPTGANHHGPEEYLHKEGLEQMQQIFRRYILSVAHRPTKTPQKTTS
jgi:succinyl-diaminopimelate desuccinylase